MLLSLSVSAFAEAAKEEPEFPESGCAIDEDGICITAGEFYELLETMLTDEDSPAYSGVEVTIARGESSPEIRNVNFKGIKATYMFAASWKEKEDFPTDDEPFTLITVMGDMSDDFNRLGMVTASTALLYLTDPDVTDLNSALDFLLELLDAEGDWIQIGAMEYSFSSLVADTYILAVREIEPYK